MSIEQLSRVLEDCNVKHPSGRRLDANETAVFSRELESVDREITKTLYPAFRSDEFIPIKPGVDPGAETYVWYRFDTVGLAKLIDNYAADLPRIHTYGSPNTSPIRSVGDAYGYSIQDIRAAALAGRPLDSELAMLSREAIERKLDALAAFGATSDQIPGFLNASGVPLLLATSLNGDWDNPATTGEQILQDLKTIEFTVWTQSKQIHKPDSMLVGSATYTALARAFSSTVPDSIMSVFLRGSSMVKSIEPWVQLDLADAGGDGERMVVYEKNVVNMHQIKPVVYETLPPQAKNLAFVVPNHARTGGVVVKRPLSMLYVDGLLDA